MLKLVVSGSKNARNEDDEYCYATSPSSDDQHKQFATKTAYELIKGTEDQYQVEGIYSSSSHL